MTANVITGIRILCGIGLIFCEPFTKWFYLLYILGGISDVLDGFVARRLKTESELGAKFDTAADIIFAAVVLVKVMTKVSVPKWLIFWTIGIAVVKCVNMAKGLFASGRFVSEHTVLNKICGILLFAIPLCIGRVTRQLVILLCILTCIMATAAALQEGYYIRIGKEV